jgi:hypothetical protein
MLIFPCTSRPKLSTPKWVEKYFQDRSAEPQIPPLRYAPVGMTILLLPRGVRTSNSYEALRLVPPAEPY